MCDLLTIIDLAAAAIALRKNTLVAGYCTPLISCLTPVSVESHFSLLGPLGSAPAGLAIELAKDQKAIWMRITAPHLGSRLIRHHCCLVAGTTGCFAAAEPHANGNS